MKGPKKHHPMSSRGTQQVSIGSTEVHKVAAIKLTIIIVWKYLQHHLTRYENTGASVSLLLGSYNCRNPIALQTKVPLILQ